MSKRGAKSTLIADVYVPYGNRENTLILFKKITPIQRNTANIDDDQQGPIAGPCIVLPPGPASPARPPVLAVVRYGHADAPVCSSFGSSAPMANRLVLSKIEHFLQMSSKRIGFIPPNEHQGWDLYTLCFALTPQLFFDNSNPA